MRLNPIDLVNEIVLRLDASIEVDQIVDNNDTTSSVYTCNPKYATVSVKLNNMEIIDVIDHGKYFEIKVKGVVTAPVFLSTPRYYHGTAIKTNEKILNMQNSRNRPSVYPMIYFPETNRQTEYPKFDPRKMIADCRLVFAVNYNSNWTSEQLNFYGVNPMIRLLRMFQDECEKERRIKMQAPRAEYFNKLGEKIEGKGTIFNAINDNCSGLVADFELWSYSDIPCCACCEIPEIV